MNILLTLGPQCNCMIQLFYKHHKKNQLQSIVTHVRFPKMIVPMLLIVLARRMHLTTYIFPMQCIISFCKIFVLRNSEYKGFFLTGIPIKCFSLNKMYQAFKLAPTPHASPKKSVTLHTVRIFFTSWHFWYFNFFHACEF